MFQSLLENAVFNNTKTQFWFKRFEIHVMPEHPFASPEVCIKSSHHSK